MDALEAAIMGDLAFKIGLEKFKGEQLQKEKLTAMFKRAIEEEFRLKALEAANENTQKIDLLNTGFGGNGLAPDAFL